MGLSRTAGVLAAAVVLTAPATLWPQAQRTAPQQGIPDAPRPQVLPPLNSITPVAPAADARSSTTPGSAAAQEVDNAGQPAPASNLPTAPSSSPGRNTDAEAAPEIPASGDAASAIYRLGTVNVNFVDVPFTVKDSKGQLVPGLTWRDVRVYENGLRQPLQFWSVDPVPLSVALVIDQSVTFDTMQRINVALGALQGAFSPYDEVSIFTYNNGIKKQTEFTAAQSNRLGVILERSKGPGREPVMGLGGPLAQTTIKNNQQVDPNTTPIRGQQTVYNTAPREFHTLNDAILQAAQETTKAGKGRRRVVYVISDGKEYGSKAKLSEVIRYLQTNKISVYATLVGDSSLPGMGFLDRIHLPLTMRDDVLPRYAAATGGQCDPEFRPRGIENSFADISKTVRTQYTLGYYSHEPMIDGKYRAIELRVMRPSLTVIAKTGYYPTASDGRPGNVGPASAAPVSSGPASDAPAPAGNIPKTQ